MAMHAVHKILAKASGKEKVQVGEIVDAKIDIAGINDIYLTVLVSFNDMKGKKVWDREKVVFFFDHNAPSSILQASENQKKMRAFIKEQGIKHLFDLNEGICHQVLPEAGMVRPGNIIIITDSHTTTHGAFGAFSTGVGSTDLAIIMMTGELWFRVPKIINVRLEGRMKDNVMAKDIAVHILGQLGTGFANYKVIEFSGSVVKNLPMDERTVLCNLAVEMGAKSAYIQPDEVTLEYLKTRTDKEFTVHETDDDFVYDKEYLFDVSELEPQIAVPHSVDNARNVQQFEGIPMDQVFIGSCTGGKYSDIAIAAEYLKGKKVAKDTRLIVTPASKEVMVKLIEKGYYQILIDAGAILTPPGCGACGGGHLGLLASDEKCASTSNRNFVGRMGSEESEVYLVSPLTAAATAVTGKLTYPQPVKEMK